jgi:hypothetical protein
VCLRVGEMRWSAAKPIGASMEPTPVDILTNTGDIGAVLMMFVRTNADTGTLEVHVYSKSLLRDRTGGLGVSVWAVRHKGANAGRGGGDLVRSTFRTATGPGTTPIARPSVSLADKKRRRAAIRAGTRRPALGGASLVHLPVRCALTFHFFSLFSRSGEAGVNVLEKAEAVHLSGGHLYEGSDEPGENGAGAGEDPCVVCEPGRAAAADRRRRGRGRRARPGAP